MLVSLGLDRAARDRLARRDIHGARIDVGAERAEDGAIRVAAEAFFHQLADHPHESRVRADGACANHVEASVAGRGGGFEGCVGFWWVRE